MMKCMLLELEKLCKSEDDTLTECLMQGSKSRKYIPLMQRQKCGKTFLVVYCKNVYFWRLQKVWKTALNITARNGK